jgi:hypothetical protein
MPSVELSHRVEKVVAYPPLPLAGEVGEALRLEELPAHWVSSLAAEKNRPNLRVVTRH